MVLCVSFSLFPVNYVLAWASVIDPAACIAVYRILSVLTKGLFVVVTMDMHFDALMEAEIALITVTGMYVVPKYTYTYVRLNLYVCICMCVCMHNLKFMNACNYVCIVIRSES